MMGGWSGGWVGERSSKFGSFAFRGMLANQSVARRALVKASISLPRFWKRKRKFPGMWINYDDYTKSHLSL